MKKKGILFVLILFCGLILSGSVFSRSEDAKEHNIRNIVLEDNEVNLSYYEDKYDIYNEENHCFKISESYSSANIVLGKNSADSTWNIEFYAYVNKEEQYFIFGYNGTIDEEIVLSSEVRIELVDNLGDIYFVSSNGNATLYEDALEETAKANCLSNAAFGDTLGLGGLSGFSDIRVGGGGNGLGKGLGRGIGIGMAVGVVAGAAIGAARSTGGITTTPSLTSPGIKTPQASEDDSNDLDDSSNIPEVDLEDLPENAQEAFKKYDKNGWKGNVSGQTEKTCAGGTWKNKKDQLPKTDEEGNPITYKEYDVNNDVGEGRDTERFVRGSDGSVYYTDSHYGDVESKNGFPPFVKLR